MLAARKMACRAEARQSEGWSQSRVLPSAGLAYETGLSAGSIAALACGHLGTRPPKVDPPPGVAPSWFAYRASASLTMLWGLWKWSARDDLHVQGCLILSQVGLLFPANHAPMKLASLTGFAPVISCMRGRRVGWTTPQGLENGEDRRICASDLMHVTHPLWLAELCPREMVGMKRAARFTSRMSNERSADELHPRNWSGWTELHRRLSLGKAVFCY